MAAWLKVCVQSIMETGPVVEEEGLLPHGSVLSDVFLLNRVDLLKFPELPEQHDQLGANCSAPEPAGDISYSDNNTTFHFFTPNYWTRGFLPILFFYKQCVMNIFTPGWVTYMFTS